MLASIVATRPPLSSCRMAAYELPASLTAGGKMDGFYAAAVGGMNEGYGDDAVVGCMFASHKVPEMVLHCSVVCF